MTVSFKMDNAAFEENTGGEAARILRHAADLIDGREVRPGYEDRLRDFNGNLVGTAKVTR